MAPCVIVKCKDWDRELDAGLGDYIMIYKDNESLTMRTRVKTNNIVLKI